MASVTLDLIGNFNEFPNFGSLERPMCGDPQSICLHLSRLIRDIRAGATHLAVRTGSPSAQISLGLLQYIGVEMEYQLGFRRIRRTGYFSRLHIVGSLDQSCCLEMEWYRYSSRAKGFQLLVNRQPFVAVLERVGLGTHAQQLEQAKQAGKGLITQVPTLRPISADIFPACPTCGRPACTFCAPANTLLTEEGPSAEVS